MLKITDCHHNNDCDNDGGEYVQREGSVKKGDFIGTVADRSERKCE